MIRPMDIELGPQRIIALNEREGSDSLRQRAMDKRSNAFTSGLGSLLQRPKAEDIAARSCRSSAR